MKNKNGFSLIELLVIIAAISILATLATVGYFTYSKKSSLTALNSALSEAASSLNLKSSLDSSSYPSELPDEVAAPKNISLELTTHTHPYYDSLSTVQNGVLLAQICQDLIDEGYGSGKNAGGGIDNYITGCGNWNRDSMQVTGWTSKVFATPLSATTLTDYADSIPPGGSWHPNQQSVTASFYRQLHSRFQAQGGSYPIESFWDYWANSHNNGVLHQELPSNPSQVQTFCIEGAHQRYPDDIWHVTQSGDPAEGPCDLG